MGPPVGHRPHRADPVREKAGEPMNAGRNRGSYRHLSRRELLRLSVLASGAVLVGCGGDRAVSDGGQLLA